MVGTFEGTYTGFRLDQADLDVFLQLVHLARARPNEPVSFSVRSLLDSIGRVYSSGNRQWLQESIQRMQACSIWIKKGSRSYAGALLGPLVHDGGANEAYVIRLNTEIVMLFEAGWSALHWQRRQQLATPLAQWLHSFTVKMLRPMTFSLSEVIRLSGSSATNEKKFRERLREAAEDCRQRGHELVVQISRGRKGANVTFVLNRDSDTRGAGTRDVARAS